MKMKKEAIFFIALPGAGKSTLIDERNYDKTHTIVSADVIKETHPAYDPENPQRLHEWSVNKAEQVAYDLAKNNTNIVFDGGGINNSYNIRIINHFATRGYKIKIIHINTPLIECLRRNDQRKRKVPREAIIEKSFEMEKSIERQKLLADEFEVIEYFTDENVFFDMDGVLCEYKSVPWLDYHFDYVNTDFFKNSKPVKQVTKIAENFHKEGKNIFILSASPNSITNQQKSEWLSKHLPFIKKENIFFVGNKDHKVAMLNGVIKGNKLKKNTVTVIDDDHLTIDKMLKNGVNVMHPSKLLSLTKIIP
jgi:predicted kinase